MPSSIILHLGYSKTASTFLQDRVFGDLEGLVYRGERFSDILDGGPFQGILARAVHRNPQVWNHLGEPLLEALLKPVPSSSNSVLVSDQGAGPHMFEESPYSGSRWEQSRIDAQHLASHLASFKAVASQHRWETLKVFLMVRRQDEWIASKYVQRSNRRLGASQAHFQERISFLTDRRRGFFADGLVLDYDLMYHTLADVVGEDHLLMLPYELFRDEPASFFERLLPFFRGDKVSTDEAGELARRAAQSVRNVRSTDKTTWRVRPLRQTPGSSLRAIQLPQVLRKFDLPDQIPLRLPDWKRDREISLTDELSEQVMAAYDSCNRRLAETLGMDLGRFGYF